MGRKHWQLVQARISPLLHTVPWFTVSTEDSWWSTHRRYCSTHTPSTNTPDGARHRMPAKAQLPSPSGGASPESATPAPL